MNAVVLPESNAITASVTSKGQLTLPIRIRERLGIQEGSRLMFEVRGDEIILRREPSMRAHRGMLRSFSMPANIEPDKEPDRALP